MRVRTLEIRWHDSKPISTCDFQPVVHPKRARPATEAGFASQTYRLATGGEDNHVRMWLVHPNLLPPSVAASASTSAHEPPPAPRPSRVEYIATLSRHSASVNVVRFSPNGEYLASAGDDGMIIIWAQSNTPHTGSYGSDLAPDEMQYEKEFWKPRITFRCTTMQVYDLAWSPTGEYVIAGSTDNCARIFSAIDGKCIHEIAEHSHYVQGVAWDPLNEYIATQSSDRSMHIYSVTHKNGNLDFHAVGKNTRMPHNSSRTSSHSRTPSQTPSQRPRISRRLSNVSEAESVMTSATGELPPARLDELPSVSAPAPLTPAASVASTPVSTAVMFPPPPDFAPSSRRSSFSTPGSPAHPGRYGRSPSPMPALPAIRTLPQSWANVRLYGDESFTNFFRRLTFSPDGGLLLTPAGQFEDPAVTVSSRGGGDKASKEEQPTRGRKGPSLNVSTSGTETTGSASSVYIYSRANFARPPIAQLPGHKKAAVAVRFSPVLYELRPGVAGARSAEPRTVIVERGRDEEVVPLDMGSVAGSSPAASLPPGSSAPASPIAVPSTPGGSSTAPSLVSPALSAVDSVKSAATPSRRQTRQSTRNAAAGAAAASVFALPYRMLYAVATMDTVTIYDTQQSGPVCLLTKLHYDEFTDMTWSPDGQCLMLSSRDGYCTLVAFDEILPAHHTQQQALQLQSIAQQHALALTTSGAMPTPLATPSTSQAGLPPTAPLPPAAASATVPAKRSSPPTNALFAESPDVDSEPAAPESSTETKTKEPPKKKRRVALTRVGDVGS